MAVLTLLLRKLLSGGVLATVCVATLWSIVALIHAFPIPWLRWPLAAGFAGLNAVILHRLRRRPLASAAALLACAAPVFLWWLSLVPHDGRRWLPEMERTPFGRISGDVVTVHNVRHLNPANPSDFTPLWETRVVRLSSLQHLDLYLVYWDSPHICHTMMTFDFGDDGRLCASIEARREHGEIYSPLAGLFRRYELLYVLGDERDVVRRRTHLSPDDRVYLFRLQVPPEIARSLFLEYLAAATRLHEQPAWYHSLVSNCSTLIFRHVKNVYPDQPWNWRLLANGHLDAWLHAQGYLDRSQPLDVLKSRSLINSSAQTADVTPDFSERIRAGLPGF